MFKRAEVLETVKELIRSEAVLKAVDDLLSVVYALEGSKRNVILAYNEAKKISRKMEQAKETEQASSSDGGCDPTSATNLATEFNSLRAEVGELSKAIRLLADRKPEEQQPRTGRNRDKKNRRRRSQAKH